MTNPAIRPIRSAVGFQYITRRGMREGGVKHFCDLMLDVIKVKLTQVKVDVFALKRDSSAAQNTVPKRGRSLDPH